MTTKAARDEFWIATHALADEECPNAVPHDMDGFEIVCIEGKLSVDGQGHVPDELCGGSGRVPSILKRAATEAVTEPCDEPHYPDVGVMGQRHGRCLSCGDDLKGLPGRVPHAVPAEVPCFGSGVCTGWRDAKGFGKPIDDEVVRAVNSEGVYSCSYCGGSGIVLPDDEATRVAVAEACGRLWPVRNLLDEDIEFAGALDDACYALYAALRRIDLAAAYHAGAEALRLVAQQEVAS